MVSSVFTQSYTESEKKAVSIFEERLRERKVNISRDGFMFKFEENRIIGTDSFTVSDMENGIKISAGGLTGLIHGAGFVLRNTSFYADGIEPCTKRGVYSPLSEIRGMYFASHFHNYYHVAPLSEMKRYIEDLALMGVNYIMLCFPLIDLESMDSPETLNQLRRHAELFEVIHSLGLKCSEMLDVNLGFNDYPKNLTAAKNHDPIGRRGDTGPTLCMSKDESVQLVEQINRFICSNLQGSHIDMFIVWPYDEGGCGCGGCAPWGAKGYIKHAKRAFETAREYFPDAMRCVSTWMFDTPYEGEWKALYGTLKKEKWCDYILADSHERYPAYPLENDLPNGVKLINFPEISMWGLFPWGGWGATMLPERFTSLYHETKNRLSGGFPYSEGIYEDINAAVVTALYFNGPCDWKNTLAQYAGYELGINNPDDFIRLVSLVEKTHKDVAVQGYCELNNVNEAYSLARKIDCGLPDWSKNCWRWRIIYLRTFLDAKRFNLLSSQIDIGNEHGVRGTDWKNLLKDEADVQEAFHEIIKLFHCREINENDALHDRVRPVCNGK